jgi:DNA-binding transcriptional LysR family regulator
MNLRRLEYFLAVVDAGTVTAAAQRLRIAQPALSRQLRTLEREVLMPLFAPSGNRLVLTPTGREFVPLARRLLREAGAVEDASAALRTGRVPRLRVASTTASIRSFLAPFVATTTPDDPRIVLQESSHFRMYERLEEGVDFVVSPAERHPGLRVLELGSVELRAYVHPAHPWAVERRERLVLADLAEERLVVPSHSSVSRFVLDNALSSDGVQLQSIDECDDGLAILAMAASGHAIGVTTEESAFGVHGLVLRRRKGKGGFGPSLRLPLHVAWIPTHYASAVIEDLAVRIRDFLNSAPGTPGVPVLPPRE